MRTIRTTLLATLLLPGLGCAAATSLLDPQLSQLIGLSSGAADIPGEAPAVLVWLENQTNRRAELTYSYRTDDGVDSETVSVDPGSRVGRLLICPLEEVTLGDVSDLDAPGALLILGAGGGGDAQLEVEAFGTLLRDEVNYDCGDAVRFIVRVSTATRSGYETTALIQRAE